MEPPTKDEMINVYRKGLALADEEKRELKEKIAELEAWKGDINEAKRRMSRKDLAHDLVHLRRNAKALLEDLRDALRDIARGQLQMPSPEGYERHARSVAKRAADRADKALRDHFAG